MLEAYIIDDIRRREERDGRVRPHLESPFAFPLHQPCGDRIRNDVPVRRDDDEEESDGVIYIDM